MVHKGREEHLFAPDKIEWLLSEGLETMGAGERQILLVMAETKIQDGYRPSREEQEIVKRLQALAGDEYDAKDIKHKVRRMVQGPKKAGTPDLCLPPAFDHLIKRLRKSKRDSTSDVG